MKRTPFVLWVALLCTPAFGSAQSIFVNAFPGLQFNEPTDIRMPRSRDTLFYITEQRGIVRAVDPATYQVTGRELVLDLTDRVVSGGELGLVSIAFDPGFQANHYFYLCYTAKDPLRSVVARYTMDSSNRSADPSTERIILEIPEPLSTHNGGELRFGPDGNLYIGVGDGGCCGDPYNRAQNLDSIYGKILRINVHPADTSLAYDIPPDNPFVGGEGRQEIYAYGFRNPWRFSFDPATGVLWCGDVGQDKWEEVDIVTPGGNYGWRIKEGPACFLGPSCDSTGLTPPIVAYEHDTLWPYGAVVGGPVNYYSEVVPGTYYPLKSGEYIYGDFVSGRIWGLKSESDGTWRNRLIVNTNLNITTFGTDLNGQIFFGAFDGYIYRFTTVAGVDQAGSMQRGRVVPNPSGSNPLLSVELNRNGYPRIEIYDVAGELVKSFTPGYCEVGGHQFALDLSRLPAGAYRWRVVLGDEAISGTLLLEK